MDYLIFKTKLVKKFLKIRCKFIRKRFSKIGSEFIIESPEGLMGEKHMIIGDNFYAAHDVQIEAWETHNGNFYKPCIEIGDNVNINAYTHIGCINKIYIGNNVLIGSKVCIVDHNHGYGSKKKDGTIPPNQRKLYSKGPIIIEDNVWIGENVIILSGVKIGQGSIIGAGSVVTHDIEPDSIAVGNPAIVRRKR